MSLTAALALLQTALLLISSVQSMPNATDAMKDQVAQTVEQSLAQVSTALAALAKPVANTGTATASAAAAPATSSATSNTSTASANATAAALGTSFSINPNNPRFNILWLEPTSLSLNRVGRPTTAEFRTMIDSYKQMGVDTIVVGYTEFLGCFFYAPQSHYSFYSYYTNSTISSSDMSRRCVPISDGDFLRVLLDESSKQGMKVILGLSDAGDVNLNLDLYANIKNGTTTYVPQTPGHTLNDRITQATNVATTMAQDLAAQYGSYSALVGWYIPHEESACLDSGNNIYAPLSAALKAATPGKLVMISPTADVKVCFNLQSMAQALAASKADIVAFQDGVGSGYREINGIGSNNWTDAARDQRISDITQKLKDLKSASAQAGNTFWINTELWRMDGKCPVNGGYGCAGPAAWASAKKQLAAWNAIAPGSLMMNEGFLNFDFGIAHAQLSNSNNQGIAAGFTKDYKDYLASTQPLSVVLPTINPTIPTSPAGPALTISATPTTVAQNGHAIVSWSCMNSQTCSIYRDGALMWNGAGNQSSAFDTGAFTQSSTYVLKATDATGATFSSSPVTVTVSAPTQPVVSISVSPTSVVSGSHATVSWTCQAAKTCSIYTNGAVSWSGDGSIPSSAFDTGALTQNTSYYIVATDAAGTSYKSSTVNVAITQPVASTAVVSISASPTSVSAGGQSTITWSAQNAMSCSISTNGATWYTGSSVFSSAFSSGALAQTSTYALSCVDAAQNAKNVSTTVVVQ